MLKWEVKAKREGGENHEEGAQKKRRRLFLRDDERTATTKTNQEKKRGKGNVERGKRRRGAFEELVQPIIRLRQCDTLKIVV